MTRPLCPCCGTPVDLTAAGAPETPGQPLHGLHNAVPCLCWLTARQARQLRADLNPEPAEQTTPHSGQNSSVGA